jgi:hypothetical protein
MIWDLRQAGCETEQRVERAAYSEYRLRPGRKIELPPAFPVSPVDNYTIDTQVPTP